MKTVNSVKSLQTPLAHLLRPTTLDEYFGQESVVGLGTPLRTMIEMGSCPSLVLWGPPGTGKTTLAKIICNTLDLRWVELSAVTATKKDVLKAVEEPEIPSLLYQNESEKTPLLFIDEIHRFSKAQQDTLLPLIESGKLICITATTENPSFSLTPALLSRMQVVILAPLSSLALQAVILRAEKLLMNQHRLEKKLETETIEWLIEYAVGDARRVLNILELAIATSSQISINQLQQVASSSHYYDKSGEYHYDTISAFIKSMRASNTDAALYYLARMIDAGESAEFIARRMVIFASEDIGLAQPTALVVANAVFDAVHKVGYPEAQINLAHGVAYLSACAKNRDAYDAYFAALADVKQYGHLPVPLHLRNAPTKLMKQAGYSKGYEMYPDENKNLLPEKLSGKKYLSKTK